MKSSKRLLLIIFLTLLTFSLSACGFFKQVNCEHVWKETIEKEATCLEDGLKLKTCEICGKTMHEKIPANKHDYEETQHINPTCTEDGRIVTKCKHCGDEKVEILPAKGHTIENGERENPTCTLDGYEEGVCSECGQSTRQLLPALGHDFTAWQIITEATSSKEGLKRRTCNRCDLVEEEVIPLIDYIDTALLEYGFTKKDEYNVTSEDELALLYSAAILNREAKIVANLNFSYDDFSHLFERIKAKQSVEETYQASANLMGKKLTLTFTYAPLPSKPTTSDKRYTQYASFNAYENVKTRSNDYNNFAIEKVSKTYSVSTSSQLVYVLERGYRPSVKEGSIAETLYNKAKEVLREIINDDMTDVEKVRSIHDYLIMNVTYDNKLYDLLYEGVSDLKEYNGFYLEGVFLDKYAVCEGISKAFSALCNIEGIPSVSVSGYSALNPSGAGHAWNKVFVDGDWYVIDCTSDGTVISDTYEVLSYEYFLISEDSYENSKSRYVADTFKNISCTKDYPALDTFKYDSVHTFTVKSFVELREIVKEFHKMGGAKKTCQIKFDYSYSSSKSNEVSKAYQSNLITTPFSYIENGDYFTIVEG